MVAVLPIAAANAKVDANSVANFEVERAEDVVAVAVASPVATADVSAIRLPAIAVAAMQADAAASCLVDALVNAMNAEDAVLAESSSKVAATNHAANVAIAAIAVVENAVVDALAVDFSTKVGGKSVPMVLTLAKRLDTNMEPPECKVPLPEVSPIRLTLLPGNSLQFHQRKRSSEKRSRITIDSTINLNSMIR